MIERMTVVNQGVNEPHFTWTWCLLKSQIGGIISGATGPGVRLPFRYGPVCHLYLSLNLAEFSTHSGAKNCILKEFAKRYRLDLMDNTEASRLKIEGNTLFTELRYFNAHGKYSDAIPTEHNV